MQTIIALWKRGIVAFFSNRTAVVFSIIMPFFFVYVFSSVFITDTITTPVPYMLSGVIIINVFASSLTISSLTIDDIVSGFMKEILVSPTKRVYVAIGQLLASATVSTLQGIVIGLIGILFGIRFSSWLTPVLAIISMIVIGIVFSAMGLLLATTVKNGQTFQLVRTAIDMPMTFISGAYIPLATLPTTLRYVAYLNPMTYATAFFRMILLEKTQLPLEELVRDNYIIQVGNVLITPLLTLIIIFGLGFLFIALATFSFSITDFSTINRSATDDDAVWG